MVDQLREGHDAKLLGATEATRPVVAAVSIDDAMEVAMPGAGEYAGLMSGTKSAT